MKLGRRLLDKLMGFIDGDIKGYELKAIDRDAKSVGLDNWSRKVIR
jgi:hypothetical protein